ncbi:hypothetical protein [uncultured Psychroserpens sp.]|uniref:hypothetical protein n=1 Tax=uncultured Psychroserpens sp. TaxID=255436 RepID=UPI00262EC99B|nr:hypothetical protein [uncultured Psychroserpens sp.]
MIVFKEEWSYTLERTNSKSYILTVVCGSIGIYDIKISLNPEEIQNLINRGKPYILQLVRSIQESPYKYTHRQIDDVSK